MDKKTRRAVLLELAQELNRHGSWCGATHLQKAAYFLTELAGVPLSYEFVLYRHGPFSFDLQDEIDELQGYGLIEAKPVDPPYGPQLAITEHGERFISRNGMPEAQQHTDDIQRIASLLGDAGVVQLERLATALYFLAIEGDRSDEEYVAHIHEAKSHISEEQAENAIATVRQMQAQFRP